MDTLSKTEYEEQYPVVGELKPESKAEMKRKTWQPRAAQLLEDEANNDEMVQTVDAIVDAAILSETPEPSSSATMASTQALDTTTADGGVSLMNQAESSPPSSAKEKTLAALSSSEMIGRETKNDEMVQTVDASVDAALSETPEPSNATVTSTHQLNTTATDWVPEATGMNITNEHITELFARYNEAGPQESKILALINSEEN